jgi:hypothetical protein
MESWVRRASCLEYNNQGIWTKTSVYAVKVLIKCTQNGLFGLKPRQKRLQGFDLIENTKFFFIFQEPARIN